MGEEAGYIGEKVQITHIQRRNEWILLPDKAKGVTPRFICYYFADNFCEKVGNYQYASEVHYIRFNGGPNYKTGGIGGDFNAIMTKAKIYTKDNQIINYEISANKLNGELATGQKQKLNVMLILLVPIFAFLHFIILKLLDLKNRKRQSVNLT